MNARRMRSGWNFLFGGVMTLLAACGGGDGGGESGSATAPASGAADVAIATIRVTPESTQLTIGESLVFTAEALDAAGRPIAGKRFVIASVNQAIAKSAALSDTTVEVTGVAQGVVNVIAAAEGKEGQAIVTVSGYAPIQVTGKVIDGETLEPLAGAQVSRRIGGVSTTTGSDGTFSMAVPSEYGVPEPGGFTASHAGYISSTLLAPVSPPATVLAPILLVKPRTAPGSVSGAVMNARDNTGIVGANVQLFQGQGTSTPILVASTTTDSQGGYSFTGVEAGVYTLASASNAFAQCRRTVVSLASGSTASQNLFCSPATAVDMATRIVLTWGNRPADLDAHLTGPNASDANRFHVYFLNSSRGSLSSNPYALLDTDQRNGQGPETITLQKLSSGVYRFSVHDYSNRASTTSTALGNSLAKVELYLPGQATPQVFNVPSQRGNLWTVFELVGSPRDPSDVQVTPRNEMSFVSDEDDVQ